MWRFFACRIHISKFLWYSFLRRFEHVHSFSVCRSISLMPFSCQPQHHIPPCSWIPVSLPPGKSCKNLYVFLIHCYVPPLHVVCLHSMCDFSAPLQLPSRLLLAVPPMIKWRQTLHLLLHGMCWLNALLLSSIWCPFSQYCIVNLTIFSYFSSESPSEMLHASLPFPHESPLAWVQRISNQANLYPLIQSFGETRAGFKRRYMRYLKTEVETRRDYCISFYAKTSSFKPFCFQTAVHRNGKSTREALF